jgi:hypothetical protein
MGVDSLEDLSLEMREVAVAPDDLREDLGKHAALGRPFRIPLLASAMRQERAAISVGTRISGASRRPESRGLELGRNRFSTTR